MSKQNWQDYKSFVESLARKTYKTWMVGTELRDITQELWLALFQLFHDRPTSSNRTLVERILVQRAAELKHNERDRVHHKKQSISEAVEEFQEGLDAEGTDGLQDEWEDYITDVPQPERGMLRMRVAGSTIPAIAKQFATARSNVQRILADHFKCFRERWGDYAGKVSSYSIEGTGGGRRTPRHYID